MQPPTLQLINIFNPSTYFHSPPSLPHPLTSLLTSPTHRLHHRTHSPPSSFHSLAALVHLTRSPHSLAALFTALTRRPLHRQCCRLKKPLLPSSLAASPHSLATLLTALTRRPLHRTHSPPSSPHSLAALFTALTHRPLHRTHTPPSSPPSLTALLAAFGNDLDAAFYRRLSPPHSLLPLAAFLCRCL